MLNIFSHGTQNSCRSQIAEGLLQERAGDRFNFVGARTRPAFQVHQLGEQVMAEKVIEFGEQRPKGVGSIVCKARDNRLCRSKRKLLAHFSRAVEPPLLAV